MTFHPSILFSAFITKPCSSCHEILEKRFIISISRANATWNQNIFFKMADASDGDTSVKNEFKSSISTFKSPSHLDEDVSSLCINYFKDDKVLVGHEKGAYIASIAGNSCSEEIVKRLQKNNEDCEVPCFCVDETTNDIFYAASGSDILKFDYRCSLDKEIDVFTENCDEINSLQINENGLLSSTDDSGECKLFDTRKNSIYRTLRNRHKNICSVGLFLKTRSDVIVTGGYDSQIIAWNFATVRSIQSINTQDLLQKLGDNSVTMFNPPMVHTMNLSSDGKVLASGLGENFLYFPIIKAKIELFSYWKDNVNPLKNKQK